MFRMPTPVKITGRASTITNSFVNSIIPVFTPTNEEILEALSILGMSLGDLRCAYCGDRATEWDHLRPIVKAQRPTGFVSEIANLVPACSKCNQSKSGHDWRSWIEGSARLSPKVRGISNLAGRIARLEAFVQWREPRRVDFEAVAGAQLWKQHWENHASLLGRMRDCQVIAEQIRVAVKKATA
jgi:hypothetical protein